MTSISIKADSSGQISIEMGMGAMVDQPCKPGKFYVYTHKDKDGVVFYVGKGTGKRAHSRDRSPEWIEYLDTKSDSRFTVEIVRDGISEQDAFEIEDAVMKIHGGTIVNRVNPHAPYDPTKLRAYCDAQKGYGESLKRATDFLKDKQFNEAILEFEAAYAHHLEMVNNAVYDLGARSGLKSAAFNYHPSSALVNGYSMALEVKGRNRDLIVFAERYFKDYAPPYNKAEETLRRRVEMARELNGSASN